MDKIKILVMDVDGTLTDGKIYTGDNGELMKAFDVKDGYAIAHMLPPAGITPVIITGRQSKIVESRCRELKITHLHQGVADKVAVLSQVVKELQLSLENAAYIGDDLNDLGCIEAAGFSGCPADACDSVKKSVSYVCKKNGGAGAVREFIEYILEEK